MAAVSLSAQPVTARKAGIFADTLSIAGRAMRSLLRDPEATIPALIIPLFFFLMNVGALQDFAERIPGLDYKAFQLPVAIMFAVTGNSRAIVIVTDIQGGYFDRLSLTPANRLAMLIGFMLADFALVVALSVPVLGMGFLVGVRFATGVLGVLLFVLIAAAWGLVFTGFPYAIAFKTGNPAAVNVSFVMFFPFLFVTTAFLPKEALTGWLSTAATYNPVTYVLAALRSLISTGWEPSVLLKGVLAIAAVGVIAIGLALWALAGRARRR